MAWVRKNKDGYVACYRDRAGKQRTVKGRTFKYKPEARSVAEEAETKAQATRTSSAITWGEWSETWLSQRTVAPSTATEDGKRINTYLSPRWADVRLSDIAREDLKAWRAEMLKEYETEVRGETVKRKRTTGTVNRVLSLMSKSLTDAVDSEVLDYNPARGLTISEGQATHERFLTKDELHNVAAELSPRWALLALTMAYTGMRWGEAKAHAVPGITQKRLDRTRGMLQIAEVWDDKDGELKPYPKGKKPRSVPVPKWLLELLPDDGPLLLSPHGAMPQNNNFRRALNIAADTAKVERFRAQDLRHTYASWLIQAGRPVEEVRQLLGHQSILTTQRYVHLGEIPSDKVLEALDF